MLFAKQYFLVLLLVIFSALPVLADHSQAEFDQQAQTLRTKLKGRGFTVIVERPFIVIGDDTESRVTQ